MVNLGIAYGAKVGLKLRLASYQVKLEPHEYTWWASILSSDLTL